MADKVKIRFSHPHDGHKVGDEATYELTEARTLISAGVAVPTKKTGAPGRTTKR